MQMFDGGTGMEADNRISVKNKPNNRKLKSTTAADCLFPLQQRLESSPTENHRKTSLIISVLLMCDVTVFNATV